MAVKNVPSSTGKIKEKKFSQHISRGKEDDEVIINIMKFTVKLSGY